VEVEHKKQGAMGILIPFDTTVESRKKKIIKLKDMICAILHLDDI
jgi:hypothetical protein